MIRVVIVDDHPMVRKGLRMLLETADDIEVAGEATDGSEVVDVVSDVGADVVLMDLRMPRIGGLEATRRLHAADPDVRIIALTAYADDERVIDAVRAGASGFLHKGVDEKELQDAIRTVHGGRMLLDATAQELLAEPMPTDGKVDRLSPRELDVIRCLASGMSNRRIAEALELSEKTVKNHISRILAKLELDDRTQAALYAVRQGVADPL